MPERFITSMLWSMELRNRRMSLTSRVGRLRWGGLAGGRQGGAGNSGAGGRSSLSTSSSVLETVTVPATVLVVSQLSQV